MPANIFPPISHLVLEEYLRAVGSNRPKCVGTSKTNVIELMSRVPLDRNQLVGGEKITRPSVLNWRKINSSINLGKAYSVAISEICIPKMPELQWDITRFSEYGDDLLSPSLRKSLPQNGSDLLPYPR